MTLDGLPAWIQAHLDEDLSLSALAARAGSSPWHFHRRFRARFGRTCARFVARARLERAAHLLLLHDGRVLDVALETGFSNHETFCRAFRRRFHMAPGEFRRRGRLQLAVAPPERRRLDGANAYELSTVRIQYLRETDLACVRWRGPYESVPARLWTDLVRFTTERRLRPGRMIGIGYDHADAPRPRFDAAVTVARAFESSARFRHGRLPRGPFAVTSHVGPYTSLADAYSEIVAQSRRLPGFRLLGLPAIEVYHTLHMDPLHPLNQTDVYLPVAEID